MHFTLMHAGISLGTVPLDPEPLAAGLLYPTDAYYRLVQPAAIRACALLARDAYRSGRSDTVEAENELAALLHRITLTSEAGVTVRPLRLELWDQGKPKQRPFVLVEFGSTCSSRGAPVLPRPSSDGGGAAWVS